MLFLAPGTRTSSGKSPVQLFPCDFVEESLRPILTPLLNTSWEQDPVPARARASEVTCQIPAVSTAAKIFVDFPMLLTLVLLGTQGAQAVDHGSCVSQTKGLVLTPPCPHGL